MIKLHEFLQTYFSAYNCQIQHDQDGVLTVQLTEELDKALMNRPFYWHYVKSTGNPGEPAQLTLRTNTEHLEHDDEWIHLGSPRLQQIFNHLRQSSKIIKLFQKVYTEKNIPLYPWLITNIKISYQGKQNKDELFSIGLNLINGIMKTNMMDVLGKIPLQTAISDYCYPISPLIKIKSGYMRIISVIEDYLTNQTHNWASEALDRLAEEIKMVEHFYSEETDKSHLQKEITELQKLFQPMIAYHIINGGLVYLAVDAINN